jgi:molybdopterin-dependent oxidoreductase alpha subunit
MSILDPKPKIAPYHHAAAGWGALKQVAISLAKEQVPGRKVLTLYRQNKPDGFDCPGCAWPDRVHTSTFEFCENGAKAVAAEATGKRVTSDFLASNTVASLLLESDYELEEHGRLTEPMSYDRASDTYRPISWDAAYALIARHLNDLPSPDNAAFYTSGRASNEASFLYQLFVRAYGTNNFPDCSNMCHESTSRGLPGTIGVGKATVTLDDLEHCDTLLLFGHNPATNHPRMLADLRDCARRGVTIVSINPLRERGLERFTSPQSPTEMLTMGSTDIASVFVQPRLGGDQALIKGIAKSVLRRDDDAALLGRDRVLDVAFIESDCAGFAEFATDLRLQPWDELERLCGVSRMEIENLAEIYIRGRAVICTWGMGLTQHKNSVATIQMLSNLMMMRGNIGRRGAGLLPVRGHSNVQGNRSMGIENKPTKAFLDKLGQAMGFEPPRGAGLDVVETIQAMRDGRVKVFFALGGNFAMACPDSDVTWEALRACDLTVHVATKLNRSHLIHGREALILPTLGRTEIDLQDGVAQGVTVEDSVCMVHLSYGINRPASEHLRSETAIVAGLADATLGVEPVDWLWLASDYARIRECIAHSVDGFEDFNERVAVPGGFHVHTPARERLWNTASRRAQFIVSTIEADTPLARARRLHGERLMVLMTMRSHDQYNTTIYGLNDRYRGVFGQRRVVFANPADLQMLNLEAGEWVDLIGVWDDGVERRADRFLLVTYDIPRGCIAAYYPETNPLVPLDSVADGSGTPTSKSIPVLLRRCA